MPLITAGSRGGSWTVCTIFTAADDRRVKGRGAVLSNGHSESAVDWRRDARAEARRRREMPEKRARSGFRVGLSHDSSVRTYRQLFSYIKFPSRKLLRVAGRGSCGSRDVKEGEHLPVLSRRREHVAVR